MKDGAEMIDLEKTIMRESSRIIIICLLLLGTLISAFEQRWHKLKFEISDEYTEIIPSLKELQDLGIECLRNSSSPYKLGDIQFANETERERHYRELINATAPFRKIRTHSWVGYTGPWIEEVWNSQFCCNKNLSEFGPYVPVFVQWLDIYKTTRNREREYRAEIQKVFDLLRKDMLYFTVVQSSYGIEGSLAKWENIPPNLLILNPTSRGHIPIPHLLRELSPKKHIDSKYKMVFAGTQKSHKSRLMSIVQISSVYGNRFICQQNPKNWINLYLHSDVILSPRGWARGCFRTYEILELGQIPLIVYNDQPWIPYKSEKFPWKDMAYISNVSKILDTAKIIDQTDERTLEKMRKKVVSLRESHFTYKGVMRQISLFLKSGYLHSDLRCDKYMFQL